MRKTVFLAVALLLLSSGEAFPGETTPQTFRLQSPKTDATGAPGPGNPFAGMPDGSSARGEIRLAGPLVLIGGTEQPGGEALPGRGTGITPDRYLRLWCIGIRF